jgi:hypothetical protein
VLTAGRARGTRTRSSTVLPQRAPSGTTIVAVRPSSVVTYPRMRLARVQTLEARRGCYIAWIQLRGY